MPSDKPQRTWVVDGVVTPERAPCLCGATLGSHMQRAPHPYPKRHCTAFRPSHAGAVVRGMIATSLHELRETNGARLSKGDA